MAAMPDESSAWTSQDLAANPHAVTDKARRVQQMFAAIAPSYDLNNRLHSLGRDQAWRRAAVSFADLQSGDTVLDVACGTGDLAIAFADRLAMMEDIDSLAARVIGVDFTFEMLPLATNKWSRHPACTEHADESFFDPTVLHAVKFVNGDAMCLPIADASVDIVSIAFGIRNVTDPAAALAEFYRVLKPGGRLIVLEFSLPSNALLRGLYNFYFRHIMPRTAALIARDRSGAYKYLPRSVNTFIDRPTMLNMMQQAGFTQTMHKPLTFGIAVVYRGLKV